MVLARINDAGVDLHDGRELTSKDDVIVILERPNKPLRIDPKAQIITDSVDSSGKPRMYPDAENSNPIPAFLQTPLSLICSGNIVGWHSVIWHCGKNRHLMTALNKRLA